MNEDAIRRALQAFVGAISCTGGVMKEDITGLYVPVGNPDWADLGDAYQQGCAALGIEPVVFVGWRVTVDDDSDGGDINAYGARDV